MAELDVVGSQLVLRLTTFEKIAALSRDLHVDTSAIQAIDVHESPFDLVKGLRAAGLSIPRRVAIGTFRRLHTGRFIVLTNRGPAVHIRFGFGRVGEWVIGDLNAEQTVQRLRTQVGL